MTVKHTFRTPDGPERSAKIAALFRRCILLLAARE